MKNKIQGLFVLGLTTVLVLGFLGPVYADSAPEDQNEKYKNLLKSTDGAIRSFRLGNEITENRLLGLENQYESLFPSASESDDFHQKIESLKQNLSEINLEELKELRNSIVQKADSEDIELSFAYKYAVFVILGTSFSLAIIVNMISRTIVDWEEVNRVRDKQKQLQSDLKEAKNENDHKKIQKLERKQREFMQQHMGTMFSPMKTMLIIFIPFIIVFSLLNSTYGGWVVAWVPFKFLWPHIGFPLLSRFFKGTFVSLGFFGWYILSYFGFSQIWRKILVPSS